MVIKGKSVAGAARLAEHLARTDTNERMLVKELKGVAAEDMREALREMEAVATGCPNCQKPFYHASINTRPDERLTDAQRLQAIDRLEKELGLTDQPRVVVVHEKEGREHCHIVWSRIDSERMRAIPDSHNYRKHELVARELEREFGHERVQGAHIERDGKPRPERTASHKEHQQAQRTGITPKAAREQLTKLWRATDSGQAFQQALQDKGWILARGDRRDFVGVDRLGGAHSLSRRIDGARAADIRARLADIDLKSLPSVADARAVQLARLSERERATQRQHERAVQGRATPKPSRRSRAHKDGGVSPTRAAGKVAAAIEKGAGKALDGLATAFEGLLGGRAKPSERDEGRRHGDMPRDDERPLDRGSPPPDHVQEERARLAEADRAARRQQYLRDFDREVPDEKQRDAEIERSRKEEGGRERKRGE